MPAFCVGLPVVPKLKSKTGSFVLRVDTCKETVHPETVTFPLIVISPVMVPPVLTFNEVFARSNAELA